VTGNEVCALLKHMGDFRNIVTPPVLSAAAYSILVVDFSNHYFKPLFFTFLLASYRDCCDLSFDSEFSLLLNLQLSIVHIKIAHTLLNIGR